MEEVAREGRISALPLDQNILDPVVEDLLRKLVEYLDGHCPDAGKTYDGEGQDVLIGGYLDGQHYALIRTKALGERGGVTLSPRETEIVRLVSRGLPTKAIAEVLDVSLWTVSTHLRRVFAKLQVSSRAEMVARALQDGLI